MDGTMLNKSEIETPRTTQELRALCETFFENVPDNDLRLNQGTFVKEFREEIFPALIFLEEKYKNRPDIRYAPSIGNQSFDGRIFDASENLIDYVECTYAIDGQLEHLRMLALNEKGHVDVLSAPKDYVRREKHRNTDFPVIHVETNRIIAQTSSRVCEVISRKLAKKYSNNPILVVAVKGFPVSNLKEIVLNVGAKTPDMSNKFSEIWLVHTSGQRAYEVPNAANIDEDFLIS